MYELFENFLNTEFQKFFFGRMTDRNDYRSGMIKVLILGVRIDQDRRIAIKTPRTIRNRVNAILLL